MNHILDTDELDQLPPEVYVATRRPPADATVVYLELRRLDDGRLSLMAYSAIEQLIECCGQDQAWLKIPTTQLPGLRDYADFDAIMLDTILPEQDTVTYEPAEFDRALDFSKVYIPARGIRQGKRSVRLELRESEGQLALLVYTSAKHLAACCGHSQEWIAVTPDRVPDLCRQTGAEVVLTDVVLPDNLRR